MPEEKHVDGDAPELLTDNVINKYINAGQITNDVLKVGFRNIDDLTSYLWGVSYMNFAGAHCQVCRWS